MTNIFNAINHNPILKNREVLEPGWMPPNPVHREAHVTRLAEHLAPITRGERVANVVITGPRGTGKRVLTNKVLKDLAEWAQDVTVITVDTRERSTPYRVLAFLANKFSTSHEDVVPFTGRPLQSVAETVRERFKLHAKPVVIAVQGIDNQSEVLLDALHALAGEAPQPIVFIFTSRGHEHTNMQLARFNPVAIATEPYAREEVRDILKERIRNVFLGDLVTDDAVDAMAEKADVPSAVERLKIVLEAANRKGQRTITHEFVRPCMLVSSPALLQAVKGLSQQGMLVLKTVVEASQAGGELVTGALYDRYRKQAWSHQHEPVTGRRFTQILDDLQARRLLVTQVKSRGRYGRTKVIAVAPDVVPEHVLDIVEAVPLGTSVPVAEDLNDPVPQQLPA